MSMNQAVRASSALANAIHEHWGLFLAEGIILVILGLIAILIPVVASFWFTLVVGWLFLISGIVGLVTTFRMRQAPGFWWSLLSGVLGIAAGIVLLVWTASGVVSLTLLLIAFFIVEGVTTIMYAIDHRNQLTGRWGWMLLSGVIDLILAVIILIWLNHQDTAYVALGLLVGINMLFGGTAMIGMALAARHPA
jgi:uncharacterized membrane protein HdeD (DUF308 family)